MDKQSRRAAVRDYKEKKVRAGVFAVRCAVTGEAWVGLSRNLDGQRNSTLFGLRLGSHMNRALQAAWNAHGEGAIAFEELEVLDGEELTPLGRADLLKRRERHWIEALGARPIVG